MKLCRLEKFCCCLSLRLGSFICGAFSTVSTLWFTAYVCGDHSKLSLSHWQIYFASSCVIIVNGYTDIPDTVTEGKLQSWMRLKFLINFSFSFPVRIVLDCLLFVFSLVGLLGNVLLFIGLLKVRWMKPFTSQIAFINQLTFCRKFPAY